MCVLLSVPSNEPGCLLGGSFAFEEVAVYLKVVASLVEGGLGGNSCLAEEVRVEPG